MPNVRYLGRSDTVSLADGRQVRKGGTIVLSQGIVDRLTALGHRFEVIAPPPKPAATAATERPKRAPRKAAPATVDSGSDSALREWST